MDYSPIVSSGIEMTFEAMRSFRSSVQFYVGLGGRSMRLGDRRRRSTTLAMK